MSNAQHLSLDTGVPSHSADPEKLHSMDVATPRAILAANLRKLIGDESVRSWAMARGLDVRLIDRMTKGGHAFTLDKIDEVAKACGVPAWQLLLPEFEPGLSIEPPLSSDDRALLERLKRLLA